MREVKPPEAIESEKSVLAAILFDPSCARQVADLVTPEDFFDGRHQKIMGAVYSLLADDVAVGLDSILAKTAEENGDGAYTARLIDWPVAIDIPYHCNKIRQAARLREVLQACSKVIQAGNADWAACALVAENKLKACREDIAGASNKFGDAMITGKALLDAYRKQLGLTWRIQGILPETAYLIVIYGLPGTYKSFIKLDMALSIATGRPWHGLKVKACRVVYIAAEGQAGALKRVAAWKKYHGVDVVELFTLLPVPCLIDEPTDLAQLIAALKSMRNPSVGLVIIDTLARSMVGDENSTSDMGKLVIACGQITRETGAQVVLVHHAGKDVARGPRGSISLTGATDCLFEVKRDGDRRAILSCLRQKDDEPFADMGFELLVQSIGFIDDDRRDLASLVPVYDRNATARAKVPKLTGARRIAYESLAHLHEEQNGPVHLDAWREAAYAAGIATSTDQAAKQKAFKRAVASLLESKNIEVKDDRYFPL